MNFNPIKLLFSILRDKISSFSKQEAISLIDNHKETNYYISASKRIYVIGDIHGCDTLLQKSLEKMILDSAQYQHKECVFIGLGDYIDRGKNTKNVIELLLTQIPSHFETIFLKGNHEIYMLGFIENPNEFDLWLEYGGRETLLSYNVIPPTSKPSDITRAARELHSNLPATHLSFLQNLKTFHIIDDYFFVHAGIDPDIPYDKQTELTLTTIRSKFLQYENHFQGKKIIHGHTPVGQPEFKPHRINLDTGAYLTNNLTIAIIADNEVSIL